MAGVGHIGAVGHPPERGRPEDDRHPYGPPFAVGGAIRGQGKPCDHEHDPDEVMGPRGRSRHCSGGLHDQEPEQRPRLSIRLDGDQETDPGDHGDQSEHREGAERAVDEALDDADRALVPDPGQSPRSTGLP